MTNITLTKNKAMLYVVGIVAATLVVSHLVQTYQSDLDETDDGEKESNFSWGTWSKKWNFSSLFGRSTPSLELVTNYSLKKGDSIYSGASDGLPIYKSSEGSRAYKVVEENKYLGSYVGVTNGVNEFVSDSGKRLFYAKNGLVKKRIA